MSDKRVMLVTGTRKGIGAHLAAYYAARDYQVVGCSRRPLDLDMPGYVHRSVDVTDQQQVLDLFRFFIRPESDFVTGQVVMLGGVS